MRWTDYIDQGEVEKSISLLQEPGKIFEVRIIGSSSRKDIWSGYFQSAETMLRDVDNVDIRNKNIYITLGEVKEECFARSQSEHFEKNPTTTSDNEIVRYRWLFIDLDPVRATGISSSRKELEKAEALSKDVYEYLNGLGFNDPIKAMSGNGYHLLYKIDVLNDAGGRALIEKCLKNLSALFDNDDVKIDTTNSNPSRICKLHGTLAQKGTSTKERPHRMSRITSVPSNVELNSIKVLKALANELPDAPEPSRQRGRPVQSRSEFDLIGFMQNYGMTYTESSNDRAKIYRLDECPFDHSHRNGDAKIFWYSNGAIAFKCHHNSCRDYKWQDVRVKFEPDAYDHDYEQDDLRIDNGYLQHKQKLKEDQKKQLEKETEKKHSFRKLKTADELMEKDIPDPEVFIGVGDELPLLVEGTCILSAKPKLGKSWLALAMCVAVAKGEDFLGYHTKQCSTLYLDLETSEALQQKRLRKLLGDEKPPKKFYLDTETDSIEHGFVDQIEDYLKQDPDIGIVVIDVFQIIRTPSKNMKETEYEHAYRDITPLNELAQKHHIAIILVCHDRKQVDFDDPFSNILGSTGLQGAATQMMVMFRKKKDDPIHISIKGKTIDGLPELDVQLDKAQWSLVSGIDYAEREKKERQEKYINSDIRRAVIEIAKNNLIWKGPSSAVKNDAILYGIGLEDSARDIGGFLHRYQGHFKNQDDIDVEIAKNGSGARYYKISKSTVDTVDESKALTVDDFQKPDEMGISEIPFS